MELIASGISLALIFIMVDNAICAAFFYSETKIVDLSKVQSSMETILFSRVPWLEQVHFEERIPKHEHISY